MKNGLPFIPAAVCILFASCSQEAPVVPTETPTLVGTVDNVYPNYGYALIRLNGTPPSEGTVLISQSPEDDARPRVGNLIVSSERLGNLRVPADIRSGSVMKGDLVFLYKNLAAPDSRNSVTPATDNQPKTPEQNIAEVKPPAPETPPTVPVPVVPAAPQIISPGQELAPSIKKILEDTPETYGETTR